MNPPLQAARPDSAATDLDSGDLSRRMRSADAARRTGQRGVCGRFCALAGGAVGHRWTPVIEPALACEAVRP